MKKLSIILVLSLFLISCGGTSTTDPRDVYDKIHSGTTGLDIGFFDNSPPKEVLENQGFKGVVVIENIGGFDVSEGILKIVVDDYLVPISNDLSKNFNLPGKSEYNLQGDQILEVYNFKGLIFENLSQTHESEIVAVICYDYKTEMREEVCIDPDFFNIDTPSNEKVCTVDPKNTGSQGGPVEVSRIEPKFVATGSEIYPSYLIYVNNVGNGEVLKPGTKDKACDSKGLGDDSWNIVHVEAELGGDKLNCSPKDENGNSYVNLIYGEDFLKCTSNKILENSNKPYVTLLNVNLTYGYTNSVSKLVKIKKI
jgi:hypothetical protein